LHPVALDPDDAFGFTPLDRAHCRYEIESYRWDGIFTPPTVEGSIQMPHTSGGMNWGGVAIDPERGLMLVNQIHFAIVNQLVPRAEADRFDPSGLVYPEEFYPMRGAPYAVKRFPLFSQFGAPCNPPPWATLTAVDLRSGKIKWRQPFGTLRGMAPFPIWLLYSDYGAPAFGGGMSTASGVYFIGASMDRYFRAIDVETGEELWRDRLPYQGHSVPMTYRLGDRGRQFVVMAAGGNPLGEMGDAIVAYALPDDR
jgi:glucose dehydrogenase